MMNKPYPIVLKFVLLSLSAILITACANPATPVATATTTALSVPTSTAEVENLNGAQVHVLGLWSGPELESFMAVKSAWEKATAGIVAWEGTKDLAEVLNERIESGEPPDIVILPNPGLMKQLAEAGRLIPLASFMDMHQIRQDYTSAWRDLGSYNGELYAIFYKVTSKSTVWYNPRAFSAANYAVPATWNDLTALADQMVAEQNTPFSVVAPGGPGSGWALTDWVSQIVLNHCGPELYDRWILGEIPWTDACIKQSFEMFNKIIQTEGYVRGGNQGIRGTTDANGSYPLYTDPPTAYMYYLASFAQAFIAAEYPDLDPGEEYDFFPFPTINPEYAGSVMVGADVVVMITDTPAARSFMTYLAGTQSQSEWISLGGFTSVNRSITLDTYTDPVSQAVAKELTEARVTRFGAGDMLPASVQKAWWKAMLDLIENPGNLDAILDSLTKVAENQ